MLEDNTILSVSNLQVSFPGKEAFTAVKDISFKINKGKTLAIVGESGSGKSLTALALMGLLPGAARSTGMMQLLANGGGIELTDSNLQLIRGKEIGMVFQEPMSSLNPVMKIGKQLTEAILVHQQITKAAARQLAAGWLGKVQLPLPGEIYHRYPHQLSGGQRQRVMIAMAMCNHPALLIADEPTTALDVTIQQEIIRLMHYLQQEYQSAMIFITHDLSLAATIADDVLVMYKGEMVEYGQASQVLQHPRHKYTQALLACKPSPDKKGHRLHMVADFLDSVSAIEMPVSLVQQAPITSHSLLLDVQNLKVWFSGKKEMWGNSNNYFKAVDDVSFTIYKGEVYGLVGESGSGKSTLGRCIIGLLPPYSGKINFEGEDLVKIPLSEWNRIRRSIQMIFQDPYSSLNPRMTIGDILAEPLIVHRIVSASETRKEVLRLLDMVQLPASAADKYAHQFSGGQRQRIGIARALSLRPELLICDECVSALDVSIQVQILNLLKDLQSQLQLTYLFISHDLSVVHYISDRVMVMHKGKIVETGTAQEVLKTPQHTYTQQLIAALSSH